MSCFKVELIGVGRGNVSKTIEAKDCFGITEAKLFALKEVGRCLMSKNYFMEQDDKEGKYGVYVGDMGRRVGTVRIFNETDMSKKLLQIRV